MSSQKTLLVGRGFIDFILFLRFSFLKFSSRDAGVDIDNCYFKAVHKTIL